MYLITTALLLLYSTTQTLACVHASGYIQNDPLPGGNSGKFAQLEDNGKVRCQGTFRIDQDGHYSIPCDEGFVYAFTQDGAYAWYGYPGSSFAWNQNPEKGSYDCDYCTPKGDHCLQCDVIQWDVYNYC